MHKNRCYIVRIGPTAVQEVTNSWPGLCKQPRAIRSDEVDASAANPRLKPVSCRITHRDRAEVDQVGTGFH